METLIQPLLIALSVATLFSIAINIWITRKNSAQIALVLKSLFLSLKEQKVIRERIDSLRMVSRETSEYQRKSAEHQRVLLSSLNRQLANLDALLKSSSQPIEQHGMKKQELSASAGPVGGSTHASREMRNARPPNPSKPAAAVPLTRVLARVLDPEPARLTLANSHPVRSGSPEHRPMEALDERRISNG